MPIASLCSPTVAERQRLIGQLTKSVARMERNLGIFVTAEAPKLDLQGFPPIFSTERAVSLRVEMFDICRISSLPGGM